MQPLYFEQIQGLFSTLWNSSKWHFCGEGWCRLWKIFICNGTHSIPHPKSLCIHTIFVLRFFNYCHPHVQDDICREWNHISMLKDYYITSLPYIGGIWKIYKCSSQHTVRFMKWPELKIYFHKIEVFYALICPWQQ